MCVDMGWSEFQAACHFLFIVLDSERWIEACFPRPVYVTSIALQNDPDVTSHNKITYELTYGFTGFRKDYTESGKSVVNSVIWMNYRIIFPNLYIVYKLSFIDVLSAS